MSASKEVRTDERKKRSNAFNDFASWYVKMLRTYPIPTKMVTSSLLSATANVISQKFILKAEKVDLYRVFQFAATAACISPLSHFWFGFLPELVEKLKPTLSKLQKQLSPVPVFVLFKLVLDQLGWSPLINVVFFSLINIFDGNPRNIVPQLKRDLWPTMKRSWSVWPIASVINLNYVPQEFRVLFANLVAFFWSMYLSLMIARSRPSK